jgi:transcriptional regulator of met regulon
MRYTPHEAHTYEIHAHEAHALRHVDEHINPYNL